MLQLKARGCCTRTELEVHTAAFVTAALGGKLSPSMTWIRDKRPPPTTRYRSAYYSLSLFLALISKEGVGPIQTADAKLSVSMEIVNIIRFFVKGIVRPDQNHLKVVPMDWLD
jgi:hypothetical protein